MQHSSGSLCQSCDGTAGDSLPTPDPAHAFVRLPFDAYARRIDTERTCEFGADFFTMRAEPWCFSNHGNIHLIDGESRIPDAPYGQLQHIDRIPIAIGFSLVAKHLPDIAEPRGAKYGIRQRMTHRVGV